LGTFIPSNKGTNVKAILICTSLVFCLFSLSSFAQKKNFALPPTDLRQGSLHQGDLFTVKMVPGDKETSFYVVGKKAGSIKLDKMTMDLIFESGGESKRVSLGRRDQAFILPQKAERDLRLELKGETPGEVDKVHIKILP